MTLSLHDVFDRFCERCDGNLIIGSSRRARTTFVIDFFREYMKSQGMSEPHIDYMQVDAVWRDLTLGHISLALEHENSHDMREFIAQEMGHLVDLKALVKVAIAYPHAGEEKTTLDEIVLLIQQRAIMTSDIFGERYLILFGFNTLQERKPAILWKGYFLDRVGKIVDERQRVVFQRGKSK